MAAKTLYDKIWDAHLVAEGDGESILYIDLHLIHEVTTPQAFANIQPHAIATSGASMLNKFGQSHHGARSFSIDLRGQNSAKKVELQAQAFLILRFL